MHVYSCRRMRAREACVSEKPARRVNFLSERAQAAQGGVQPRTVHGDLFCRQGESEIEAASIAAAGRCGLSGIPPVPPPPFLPFVVLPRHVETCC